MVRSGQIVSGSSGTVARRRVLAVAIVVLVAAAALGVPASAKAVSSDGWSGYIHYLAQTSFQGSYVEESLAVLRGADPQTLAVTAMRDQTAEITCDAGTGTRRSTFQYSFGPTADISASEAALIDLSGFAGMQWGAYRVSVGTHSFLVTQHEEFSGPCFGVPSIELSWLVPSITDAAGDGFAEEGWTRLHGTDEFDFPGYFLGPLNVRVCWSLTKLPDADHDGLSDGEDPEPSIFDINACEIEPPPPPPPPEDTTPPTVTCSASPSSLWPPNQKLVPVTVIVSVNDAESGPAGFVLLSVTSSQADSGLTSEDVPNDIQGFTTGTADTSGLLRAERFFSARTYTLTYMGSDVAGNTATCVTTVSVPKNQRSEVG
jgi:hypothetical protein